MEQELSHNGLTQVVSIERMSYGSAGVGHLKSGKTVFVDGVVPGDQAAVQVIQDEKRFAKASLIEIIEPSALRIAPHCSYAGICGGCPWQHIAYDAQLEYKASCVKDALVRIGHMDASLVDTVFKGIVPSSKQWGYRNKVEFDASQDAQGKFALGMHQSAGDFIPLQTCALLSKSCAKAPGALTGAIRYLQGSQDLQISRVGIRTSARTKEVEIALWTYPSTFPRAAASKVLTSALKSTSVVRVLQKGPQAARKVSGVEALEGKGCWQEQVGKCKMLLSAPSFFQVNTLGAEALTSLVLEYLQPNDNATILDLYSGAGTFTLALAKEGAQVCAVESYGSSVRDFRRNLEINGLYADVVADDVARVLPKLPQADGAVIDPPRAGLGKEVVQQLIAYPIPKVAYVSCDPTTLARDLEQLLAGGYALESITCVDLFPQTYHVETVVLMSRVR